MPARYNDMIDDQKYYDLEHKVKDLGKDMDFMRQRVDDDHQNLKIAIKDLADSHKQLSDSVTAQSKAIVGLESSLRTVAATFSWGIPILVTVLLAVISGMWLTISDTDKQQFQLEQRILENQLSHHDSKS